MKALSTSLTRLLLASCLATTVACGGDDDTAGSTEPTGQVNIFSWWVSGGEVDALNALIAVHEKKYPKTDIKNLAEDLADEARGRLEQLMAEGNPPDLFQANIGADQFKWVLFNGTDDAASKVESLNALADKNGWRDVYPPAVIDALSYDGTIYGVPANIHRINALFYNVGIFEEQGLTAPETTEQLLTTAQALDAAGYTPLCLGSDHPWTLSLLLFENIFPAMAGGDYYTSYLTGNESPESDAVNQTLDYMLELWPYFNSDANNVDWTKGIDHMFDEDAPCAMTVMGDWAKGYLESKGWKPGVDFEQVPFPGSNGTFVFTADTFPLPKGGPNRTGAVAFLETIGSVEGQVAFNLLKGSIPVRTDVDPMEFDATARRTMADFTSNKLVKAFSGLVPQNAFVDLAPSIKDMVITGDKDVVLNVLSNDYSQLK